MTPQQMFDTAVVAIIRQGKPSYDKTNDACLYRGPGKTACAIGQLVGSNQLRDLSNKYRREFRARHGYRWENHGRPAYESASAGEVAEMAGYTGDHLFPAELQDCHDSATSSDDFVKTFVTNCEELCLKFRLDPAAMKLAYDEYLASQPA